MKCLQQVGAAVVVGLYALHAYKTTCSSNATAGVVWPWPSACLTDLTLKDTSAYRIHWHKSLAHFCCCSVSVCFGFAWLKRINMLEVIQPLAFAHLTICHCEKLWKLLSVCAGGTGFISYSNSPSFCGAAHHIPCDLLESVTQCKRH